MFNKKIAKALAATTMIATVGLTACGNNEDDSKGNDTTQSSQNPDDGSKDAENEEKIPENPDKNDLNKARVEAEKYAKDAIASKEWTEEYLSLPDGGGFNKDVAKKAVESIDIDWQGNANKTMDFYVQHLGQTKEEARDYLVFQGLFTKEQAQKAFDSYKG